MGMIRKQKLTGRWVVRIHESLEDKKKSAEVCMGRHFPEWTRQILERALDDLLKSGDLNS